MSNDPRKVTLATRSGKRGIDVAIEVVLDYTGLPPHPDLVEAALNTAFADARTRVRATQHAIHKNPDIILRKEQGR